MRPISISTPAADLCGVRSFWETLSADGVIFMNSSLDRESAYQLKLSGIPFVAANRMPREWGVNCVEFDHESALRLFLKALIRRGRRRIALLNPRYPLPYFREIIFSAYFEVMNAYAIFDPELFVYPDESQPYEAALAAGVERLLALPRPPDAIYSSVPEPELRRILAEHRVTLPKAVECGFSRIFEEPAPDGGEPGLVYRYDRLRESLWELLQLVIADPVRTPETRLIPVPVIGPDGELLTAATNSQPRN